MYYDDSELLLTHHLRVHRTCSMKLYFEHVVKVACSNVQMLVHQFGLQYVCKQLDMHLASNRTALVRAAVSGHFCGVGLSDSDYDRIFTYKQCNGTLGELQVYIGHFVGNLTIGLLRVLRSSTSFVLHHGLCCVNDEMTRLVDTIDKYAVLFGLETQYSLSGPFWTNASGAMSEVLSCIHSFDPRFINHINLGFRNVYGKLVPMYFYDGGVSLESSAATESRLRLAALALSVDCTSNSIPYIPFYGVGPCMLNAAWFLLRDHARRCIYHDTIGILRDRSALIIQVYVRTRFYSHGVCGYGIPGQYIPHHLPPGFALRDLLLRDYWMYPRGGFLYMAEREWAFITTPTTLSDDEYDPRDY